MRRLREAKLSVARVLGNEQELRAAGILYSRIAALARLGTLEFAREGKSSLQRLKPGSFDVFTSGLQAPTS